MARRTDSDGRTTKDGMARIRSRITRFSSLGPIALVLALISLGSASALVIGPSAADAAVPAPAITVGTNVNLSKAVGNQFEGSVAIDPTNPLRMFVLARDETGNLLGARSSDGGATWSHGRVATCTCSADKLPPAWGTRRSPSTRSATSS